MRVKPHIEIMVGFLLLLSIVALSFLAFKVSGLKSYVNKPETYLVHAEFDDIGNLKERASIRLAGVRIGQVVKIHLNPETFRADVVMAIYRKNNLPIDSSLRILTEGLLGTNYLALTPGYSDQSLKEGARIEETHSAMILENLIGQLLYRFKDDDKKDQKKHSKIEHKVVIS